MSAKQNCGLVRPFQAHNGTCPDQRRIERFVVETDEGIAFEQRACDSVVRSTSLRFKHSSEHKWNQLKEIAELPLGVRL